MKVGVDMITEEDVIRYYKKLDRSLFMEENKCYAGIDAAFSIGYGQTISQPSLVLKMTLMLGMSEDCRVLEIGTGSGYQTALLAKFTSKVYTVERIEPLKIEAEKRLIKLGFLNIKYMLSDGSKGWKEEAPFDRIIVTAAAKHIPKELIKQLAPDGVMIIPVGGDIQRINIVTKDEENNVNIKEDIPVIFVKLIGDY
ncbi:MAG: protein-L-isoaspartate(D-aspartate) O-methyltransferase [Clostridiales bacterium]|nr:protein-L-isoaspartate(D-aspartate) O-methyltransferase [Clostridiales bacterium]